MRVVGVATTHDDLAGVSLLIRDFRDPALEAWLALQARRSPKIGSGELCYTSVDTKREKEKTRSSNL